MNKSCLPGQLDISHYCAYFRCIILPHLKDQALSPPEMKPKKRIILPVSVYALKVVFDVPVVMVMLVFIVYCDMCDNMCCRVLFKS